MIFDLDRIKKELRENGYSVFIQNDCDFKDLSTRALEMCKDESYQRGSIYRAAISQFPKKNHALLSLVINHNFANIFYKYSCTPKDVFITHDFKSEISRNNYLHFDRLRALKVLVYLSDVDSSDGPFSVVPGTHIDGLKLRRSFSHLNDYEEKKNRIDIDYPEIEYDLKTITGQAGTTVLFDSDIFHCGGNISKESERLLIRSHWYPDMEWRMNS